MAVFRVQRTRDYTVMSNYHLRDQNLTLKAKGLLSMMLSLPDEWNYTTRGLAAICKEGVDAIGSALKELENTGYTQPAVTTPTQPASAAGTSSGTGTASKPSTTQSSTTETVKETEPVTKEPGEGFSENGNSVTRDLLYDKYTNKQFITITDRDGNTFYLVIDYDSPVNEDEEQYRNAGMCRASLYCQRPRNPESRLEGAGQPL